MKPTVYIETTIPSYLTARPSRDLILAARQQVTRDWWARRDRFDLVISELVLLECQAGDIQAAADRFESMTGLLVLEQNQKASALAEVLVRKL